MLLDCVSDMDQRCLKTRNSKDGCTFPPNIFSPTPKTVFWGHFNAKPIIERADVNGATKLKLLYNGIGKYLEVRQNFSDRSVRGGGAGPPKVNLGPPNIPETTTARKFEFVVISKK